MNRDRPARPRLVRTVVALLALTTLAGCSDRDPLQVGSPTAASPAAAPAPTVSPAGTLWRVPGARAAEGIAVDPVTGRVAVGVSDPPRLAILDAGTGRQIRSVELPTATSHVVALPDGGFRAVAGRQLVTVPAKGPVTRVKWSPAGHALAVLPGGGTAVTFPREGTVGLYAADGELVRTIRTRGRPEGIAAAGDRIGVVDAEATSLTVYRTSGKREQGLRAGNGALHVVADADGRFVVADTRDGELLVFSTDPLYLRQRYPVPGSPYGMAYDPTRHRVWLTLTARNEVVGFELSGGAPKEVARHPTVRQPDSVAVDPSTGTVYVAGRAQGVVQSIPG